ncbi:hypothetical protein AIOGIFDO_01089 [Candidatus Methanoperedenaceae archaeon GB37]|nr:hypothetical protein AIOGIFDO_01089 [Candidatus Methanoperedenaceae archaeon GB37]
MLKVREIVEELRVFERNKVPFEVKVLGIATCISDVFCEEYCQLSLSELHPVSKTLCLEQGSLKRNCLFASEKKRRYSIALH